MGLIIGILGGLVGIFLFGWIVGLCFRAHVAQFEKESIVTWEDLENL